MTLKELGEKLKEIDETIKVSASNYNGNTHRIESRNFLTVMLNIYTDGGVTICGGTDMSETNVEAIKLIIDFMARPVGERIEPKKYYLKHKWLEAGTEQDFYLNYYVPAGKYTLDDQNEVDEFKTTFPLEEIEDIKQKYNTNLEDFEIVEVEDEN